MSHRSATKLNRFRLHSSRGRCSCSLWQASHGLVRREVPGRAGGRRDAMAAIRAQREHALYGTSAREDPASRVWAPIAGPTGSPAPHRRGGCWGSTSSPTPPSSGVRDPMQARGEPSGLPMPPWGLPLPDAWLGTIRESLRLERLGTRENPNDGERSGEAWSSPGRLRELSLYKTATSDAGLDGVGRLARLRY